jgi:hypothetical protein
MKIFDQFGDQEFSFIVNWDVVKDGETEDYAGVTLVLKNKNLKITVECTSLKIFKYISDELFTDRIATLDEVLAKFSLTKANIEQTNQLCSLDSENEFMQFKNGANVYVSGGTFDLMLWENPNEHDGVENSINLFKEQFSSIDVEDYHVKMGDDKLIFQSVDEFTTTAISRVEKD